MRPHDEDRAAIERLRRSLYRPGADEQAVQEYRQLAAEVAPPERAPDPADPDAPPAAGRARRRSRFLAPVLGAAAVVLLAVAVPTLTAVPTIPTPTPSPTATIVPADATTETLGLDPATSTAIVSGLDTGSTGGLAFLFDFHPEQRPAALQLAKRYALVELDGTGSGTMTIPVRGGAEAAGGGRVTVILVTATDVEATWSVVGLSRQPDQPMRPIPIFRWHGEQRSGQPVAASARYLRGGAPALLTVRLPSGVRWGAAVVFTS